MRQRCAVLESVRLTFEPLMERHAALLHEPLQDPRLYRWIPQQPPSLEYLQERYRRLETRLSPDGAEGWLNWALKLKATGDYVGNLEATLRANGAALMAYFIFPAFWRHGYAREACHLLCAHLCAEMGMREIDTLIDTRNAASIALMQSLGFMLAERIPGADFFKGSVSDEYRYRLLARDFLSAHGAGNTRR
jgi:RimJ/RimL family protein N-acetyltransferase